MTTGLTKIIIEIDVTRLTKFACYTQAIGIAGLLRQIIGGDETLVQHSLDQQNGGVVSQLSITIVQVSAEEETHLKTTFRNTLTSICGIKNVLRIEVIRPL